MLSVLLLKIENFDILGNECRNDIKYTGLRIRSNGGLMWLKKKYIYIHLRMRASLYLYKYTITDYGNSVTEFCTYLFHDKQCFGIWQLHDKSFGICRRRMRMVGRVWWFNFFIPLAATGILTFFSPFSDSFLLSLSKGSVSLPLSFRDCLLLTFNKPCKCYTRL